MEYLFFSFRILFGHGITFLASVVCQKLLMKNNKRSGLRIIAITFFLATTFLITHHQESNNNSDI